jgi:hypothetical protein
VTTTANVRRGPMTCIDDLPRLTAGSNQRFGGSVSLSAKLQRFSG